VSLDLDAAQIISPMFWLEREEPGSDSEAQAPPTLRYRL
jgi:hypothetical protein